jgi:hypothetical protein
MRHDDRKPPVECEIHRVMLYDNDDRQVPGVMAVCSRCDFETESFGRKGASVRRCLVEMRNSCPRGEDNFYVADDGSDQEDKR